ncbi:hypothetical protein SNOG_06609 [Parastagonospora nodorum SN15]|uniref:Uncharacterized protein n=1 Tax=Phaeosphaeria nodorum (strain SN15 / ATCC MYA-4574 / FGSC 10173) TaxID=321614 RepID=Q0UNQ5_PHANO|nr:hypothetical protein SNOG_06609 [Parastagonospora nodorum SN15]EAT86440.1 hypothetical protein SNOG_06609 [Parastagonospora nodorum SN15]
MQLPLHVMEFRHRRSNYQLAAYRAEEAHADLIGSDREMHQVTGDRRSIPKADRQL